MQNSALTLGKETINNRKIILHQAKQQRDHTTNFLWVQWVQPYGRNWTHRAFPPPDSHVEFQPGPHAKALDHEAVLTSKMCNSSPTVETRPRGSAQPGTLCLSFCCFQEGFSPNKSFRKSHSGFGGSTQPPWLETYKDWL